MATLTTTATGSGLTFTGMTHVRLDKGFDLRFHVADNAARLAPSV